MTCFELVKRVVGLFVYPVSYQFRTWPRLRHSFWWLWLDDSIVLDSIKRGYGPIEYCGYGKREPLGFLTEKMQAGPLREFLRAYSWGCLRNNCINLRDVMAAGPMIEVLWRAVGVDSFYEVRRFAKGWALPYLELWFGEYRLQAGWLTGCGQWQVSFIKKL